MSNQSTNKDLYTKWLNNELSDTELEVLKATGDLAVMEKIMSVSDSWSLPKPKKSYQDLKTTISNQTNKKSKVISMYSFLRIAASIVLFLGISYFTHHRFFDTTEFQTLAQETKNITLPDGSKVILNSNSSLSFNNYNWTENRVLKVNGQAYFDVQKNKGTFNVNFENGSIEVLGTQFDILNHHKISSVNCYEGKIATTLNKKEFTLTANMGVKTNGITIEEFTVNNTGPTWASNFTNFNNASLEEVLANLSLKYGVIYEFDKGINLNKSFTGQFVNNDLKLALEMVLTPMSLKFNQTDSIVYIIK